MRPFRKGLLLLTIPAAEYAFLRVFLHYVLGLRIGFANTTDFDFLIPVPIAFLILVHCLDRAKPLVLNFSARAAAVNLGFLILFLGLNALSLPLSVFSPAVFCTLWVVLILGVAVSSLLLFLRPKDYLTNPNRLAFLPCVIIGSSLYFYLTGFKPVWNVLGAMTAWTLHLGFTTLSFPDISCFYTPEEAVRIDHPFLSIRIARGCGGGDGLFFFTLSFLLVSLLTDSSIRIGRWIAAYLTGLVMMFALNLLRILLLFGTGIFLGKSLGYETGVAIFKTLFHVHIGWLLYSAGIFFFLKGIYPLAFMRPEVWESSRENLLAAKSLPLPLFAIQR